MRDIFGCYFSQIGGREQSMRPEVRPERCSGHREASPSWQPGRAVVGIGLVAIVLFKVQSKTKYVVYLKPDFISSLFDSLGLLSGLTR